MGGPWRDKTQQVLTVRPVGPPIEFVRIDKRGGLKWLGHIETTIDLAWVAIGVVLVVGAIGLIGMRWGWW